MTREAVAPCPRPKSPVRNVLLIVGAAAALVLLYIVFFHSTRLPPSAPAAARGTAQQSYVELDGIREMLRRDNDLNGCRTALGQLNSYLTRSNDGKRPAALGEHHRELLQTLQLQDDEVNEIGNPTFTPLDAQHLDLCFMLQETARSLDLAGMPELERAVAAFGWVVRQVRLRESDDEAVPPQYVLRRGWGSALERALTFLALLDQLGMPGCMIALPQEGKEPRYWIPGALADGQIYLFDTRLGLPLPGPTPGTVLTLAQLRTRPDALALLQAGGKATSDVSPDQARKADPCVAVPLSALSPRMRYLKDEVLGESSKVRPAADAAALLKAYQTATEKREFLGSKVNFWTGPRNGNCSLLVLRAFLGPGEGGTDRPLDPRKPWKPRRERFEESLVPWQFLPPGVPALLPDADPARPSVAMWLRRTFAAPFADLAVNPHRPREQMLRGRLEDATAGLVAMRDDLEKLRTRLQAEDDLAGAFAQWLKEASQAQTDVLAAEDRARRERTAEAIAAVQVARGRVAAVLDNKKSEKPLLFVTSGAVTPLTAEGGYLLALCKHEQAEQAQAVLERRKGRAGPDETSAAVAAWKDAATWWKAYLDDSAGSRDEAAVRLLYARALEKQGDRAAARTVLINPPSRTSPWEKLTFAIRLQQLGERGEQ